MQNSHILITVISSGFVVYLFLSLFYDSSSIAKIPQILLQKPAKPFEKRYFSMDFGFGRLGNNLFELATCFGIAKKLGRTPIFWIKNEKYRNLLERVQKVLPGLIAQFETPIGDIPKSALRDKNPGAKWKVYQNLSRLEQVNDEYLVLMGFPPLTRKYFENLRNEILTYLAPHEPFPKLPVSDDSTFVICAHTRRGDFKPSGLLETDTRFLKNGIRYLHNLQSRSKSGNLKIKVAIFGDDFNYQKEQFPTAQISNSTVFDPSTSYFISANSPSDDLIYSSRNCDTVLITAPDSTFGWWMGYVSKGNNVYYPDGRVLQSFIVQHPDQMVMEDYYMPKWTALKFDTDMETIIESKL